MTDQQISLAVERQREVDAGCFDEPEDEHGPDNPCDDRGCDICNPPEEEESEDESSLRG